MLALDRRGALAPVAIQSQEGGRLLAGVPEGERLLSAHAVAGDGVLSSAGDAVAPIAAVLPAGALTAPLVRGLAPAMRAAYRVVAGRRTSLGRLVSPVMLARADERIAAHGRDGRARG